MIEMFNILAGVAIGLVIGLFLVRFLLEYFDKAEDELEIFYKKLKEQNERKMK